MNRLLRSLEDLIVRSDAPDESRTRIIRFTKRGRAAYSKICDILRDIEHEWSAEPGSKHFAQLKELPSRVWESPLTAHPDIIHPVDTRKSNLLIADYSPRILRFRPVPPKLEDAHRIRVY
jgi:hypothetical protein